MSFRQQILRIVWLAVVAGSAAGGWFFGRGLPRQAAVGEIAAIPAKVTTSQYTGPSFAPGSPQGRWIAQVKHAGAADFPKLIDEWKILFPEGGNYLEGRPENALRWLLAMWLTTDTEGFLAPITCPDYDYSHWAAQVLVRLMPEKAAQLNGARDDLTFKQLAVRAVHVNPEQALAALDQMPEAARASFAGEIIKQLPATDPEQSILLLGHLTKAQWDEDLGRSLGGKAEDYAAAIAALPAATTLDAQQSFMAQWGEKDPEAAARWLGSLPDYAASQPAVKGLAAAWASYDGSAASVWVETLPAGPARDGATAGLAKSIARCQPEEGWHWAATIADPRTRWEAFSDISTYWGSKAPDEFRAALSEVRQAAGFKVEVYPADVPGPDDPFKSSP